MTHKTFFFFFVSLFFFYSFSQDLERRVLTMGPFFSLSVYSGLDIKLIKSDVNKAVVFGDHKDDLILTLKRNTLKIKLSTKSLLDPGYTYVELYHSKPLDKITAHQGSSIVSEEPIKQTNLRLVVKTGAEIKVTTFTECLDVNTNTGGRVGLKGSVVSLNLIVSSGGTCDAEKLISQQSEIRLIAAGYAHITATELIDAKVFGGGVLRVYGRPVKQTTQTKLGGKIIIR
ncbi:DUF2807 domain-containing protein [Flavobacteriaceae bacterium]|nr:DUF2807 domain-containing protein [Flavobacteriaceae bacterium]